LGQDVTFVSYVGVRYNLLITINVGQNIFIFLYPTFISGP